MTNETSTTTKSDLRLSKGTVVEMGNAHSKTGTTRPQLLTEKEAAAYLGIEPQTLCAWRTTQRYNLRFIKVGRLVRYKAKDVAEFIERQTIAGQ